MNADERRLLHAWRSLASEGQTSLLDYAEFLQQRAARPTQATSIPQTPQDIPRPAEESVIRAVRRLKATYPMLESDHSLLNEVSSQMTRHLIHGDPAAQIIDRLELIFRQKYDTHRLTIDPAL